MLSALFFHHDPERDAHMFASPRPCYRVVHRDHPFLTEPAVFTTAARIHHPHARRYGPWVRQSRPAMRPSFWEQLLGASEEESEELRRTTEARCEGSSEHRNNQAQATANQPDRRTESDHPATWRMRCSYTSSGDGRTTTKRVYETSEGERSEEEVRELIDGDRVITKHIKSSAHGHGDTDAEAQAHGKHATEEIMQRGGTEPTVLVDGAKDESEFDSLWNQRTKCIEERREKARQAREQRRRQYEMRRAEHAAATFAHHAEILKKRAEEAEAAAKEAERRYRELLEQQEEEKEEDQGMRSAEEEEGVEEMSSPKHMESHDQTQTGNDQQQQAKEDADATTRSAAEPTAAGVSDMVTTTTTMTTEAEEGGGGGGGTSVEEEYVDIEAEKEKGE